jgi:hypothetical protein
MMLLEQLVCNFVYLFGRDGIYLPVKLLDIPFLSIEQVALAEVKGKLFPIVTGNANLSLDLPLGCIQLPYCKRIVHQTVQFPSDQSKAS